MAMAVFAQYIISIANSDTNLLWDKILWYEDRPKGIVDLRDVSVQVAASLPACQHRERAEEILFSPVFLPRVGPIALDRAEVSVSAKIRRPFLIPIGLPTLEDGNP